MEYTGNENRDRRTTRNDGGMGNNNMDEMEDRRRGGNNGGRNNRMEYMEHMDGMNRGNMQRGNVRMHEDEKHEKAAEIYEQLNERMCQALDFHSQLADFFCFLGLQGYKRMAEYQFMKECAEKRKMHRRYIDMHNRILPVEEYPKPLMIPREWTNKTTEDIDDSVIPKYVRMGLKQYYEWEKETKEIYEDLCEKLTQWNMFSDYEYIMEHVRDAEKECKKAKRLCESLNKTGYDVNMIHQSQDKLHEKYKKKYEDRFTTKNNYSAYDNEYDEDEEYRRGGRRRRYQIGY